MKTPAQNSVTLTENEPFIDVRNARYEDVTIASDTIDTNNTPTTQLRKGLIVGEESAGTFVDAADAGVTAHANAAITSAEAPDGDWEATTLTVEVIGAGRIAYTLGSLTTVTNLATAIADINNGPLGALVFASNNGGGLLTLTAVKPGAVLSVTSSLATAYAAGANTETTASPTFTKYGILAEMIPSMLGIDDAVEAKNAKIVTGNAVVLTSALLGLTTAARQYLAANGVIFQ